MPLAALVLSAGCATAVAAVAPLPEAGEQHQVAATLLIQLSRGEVAPLTTATANLFVAPPAINGQPFTRHLPAVLDRLDAPARLAAVAALDQLAGRLLAEAPYLAADLLPAPQAEAAVRHEADRRWDAGDLDGFRELARLVAPNDPRLAAVRTLAELPDPGWPLTIGDPVLPPARWALPQGWLLALDAWGRVRWQQAVGVGQQVVTGHDGACLRDGAQAVLFDRDGNRRDLPPLPVHARILGVADGAAWITADSRVWRVGATITEIPLGEPPCAAPLDGRLWLTPTACILIDGDRHLRSRHGLPATPGWDVVRDVLGRVVIRADDGRRWLLPPLDDDPAAWERAGRFAALDARGDLPPSIRFRRALRLGQFGEAATLAADARERELVAWYAGCGPPPAAAWPRDPAELAVPDSAWSQVLLPGLGGEPAPVRIVDGDGRRMAERVGWWQVRWLAQPFLTAPGRSLAVHDGVVVVGEGDNRVLVLDHARGDLRADLLLRQAPVLPSRTWPRWRGDTVAGLLVLAPPGIDDHLWWIGADGEHREALPQPALMLDSRRDGRRVVTFSDGRRLERDDAHDPPGPWRPSGDSGADGR